MNQHSKFIQALPDGFFVDPGDLPGLQDYAVSSGFLEADEPLLAAGQAGEGNMNLTLRLETPRRTIVLKQARPWVEKYPDIAAPADRALVETAFYQSIQNRPAIRDAMPRLLGSDPDSRVIILEDLGRAQDLTSLYASSAISESEFRALVSYLVALHEPLPLDAITPGLQAAAAPLKRDADYSRVVERLGAVYLDDGPVLLHGDFFSGSWLRTEVGFRVIDPEFCFLGEPAFDVGFTLRHLYLANQPRELGEALLELYGRNDENFMSLARQFAGVEIMRRLIGVAQLPLTCGLEKKKELLAISRELVLSAPI